MKALLIMFALSLMTFAQDAIVVPLSPQDAAKAQALAAAKKKAEDAVIAFNEQITRKYLATKDKEHNSNCINAAAALDLTLGPDPIYIIEGFGCGDFVFSKDYKYIVPAPEKATQGVHWSGGCVIPTFDNAQAR